MVTIAKNNNNRNHGNSLIIKKEKKTYQINDTNNKLIINLIK